MNKPSSWPSPSTTPAVSPSLLPGGGTAGLPDERFYTALGRVVLPAIEQTVKRLQSEPRLSEGELNEWKRQ